MGVLRALLDSGANLEAKFADGSTALCHAICNMGGQEASVKLLLERGADFEVKEHGTERRPLSLAVVTDNDAVMRLLLEKGAELEAKCCEGRTALSNAAMFDSPRMARLLIEKGANIETTCNKGWTPLIYAAYHGRQEVARLLLEKGADVEAKCPKGETPLSYAEMRRNKTLIRLLLDKGTKHTALFDETGEDAASLCRVHSGDFHRVPRREDLDAGAGWETAMLIVRPYGTWTPSTVPDTRARVPHQSVLPN